MDGTVLATDPCTDDKVGAYGHEPGVRMVVGRTGLASPVGVVEDEVAQSLTGSAGFIHTALQHLLHEESHTVRKGFLMVFRCDIDLISVFVEDACDDDRDMMFSVIGHGTVGIDHLQQVHVTGSESQ